MRDDFDSIDRAVRSGNYSIALEHAARLLKSDALSEGLRFRLADLLERTGDLRGAEALATDLLASSTLPVQARAHLDLVLGSVARARGDLACAIRHFQHAALVAEEARSPQLAGWAKFRLVATQIEEAGPESSLTLLPQLRQWVNASGDNQLSAALHILTSEVEARRGLIDSAQRHAAVAHRLLKIEDNAWLMSSLKIALFAIAYMRADLATAESHAESALSFAESSGHAMSRFVSLCNIGHLALERGDYSRAEKFLVAALKSCDRPGGGAIGVLDGLAQVALAAGDQARSELYLCDVEQIVAATGARTAYNRLWSQLTRVKLMAARGKWLDVEVEARRTMLQAAIVSDKPLQRTVGVYLAEALHHLGRRIEALALLVDLETETSRSMSPLLSADISLARAHFSADYAPNLARAYAERAQRVYQQLGYRRRSIDIDSIVPCGSDDQLVNERDHELGINILESLASVIEVAHHPQLVAGELQRIIECVCPTTSVGIISGKRPSSSAALYIGESAGTQYWIHAINQSDGFAYWVMPALRRLTVAARRLDILERERMEQLAIWPRQEETPALDSGLFESEASKAILRLASRAASTNITILITGETGVGKEVLARYIHQHSPRANKPFLPFNCTAVPREMLDSQLFGHRRGAFTGAQDHFPGVIRAAGGGTLFMDEIGEVGLDVQPKLLRFLEAGEIHPIGEPRPVAVDVRVIAATNADLDRLVTEGRFREDLFYRLNVVRFRVPPLRERREEIPLLVHHFVTRSCHDFHKDSMRVAEETMEYLLLYSWPGNVRQLANEIRRMIALAEPGAIQMPEHLSSEILATRRTIPASERTLAPIEVVVRLDQPMAAATAHLQRAMVQHALRETNGHLESAARLLGVSRKGLYLKRHRLGFETDDEPEAAGSALDIPVQIPS